MDFSEIRKKEGSKSKKYLTVLTDEAIGNSL